MEDRSPFSNKISTRSLRISFLLTLATDETDERKSDWDAIPTIPVALEREMEILRMIKSIRKPQSVLVLFLCFFACFVAGCAIQPQTQAETTSLSMPARIRISLTHSPTGTANLLWSSTNHTLMVTINVTGLAPGSTHLVHIHSGTCAAMGQIVYDLLPLIADAHGVGLSTTSIAGVMSGIPARGWAVNIHNGPTFATGLDARPIACGNITSVQAAARGEQSARATLATTISPDENVHGMAQISRMDQTIIVTLSLSGMAPNTTHLAHIHAGSCAAQGPVLFPLKPIVADAQGRAMTITTITVHTLPPAHWYINVHEAGTMAAMMTPQGFLPIACGNGGSLF
jgi:CHRD domain